MKRVRSCSLLVIALTISAGIRAGAQSQTTSLGDYARAIKKTNPPAKKATPKVYDNDNMPTSDGVSVVGTPPQAAASADTGNDGNAKAEDRTGSKAKNGDKAVGKNGEEKADKKPSGEIKPDQSSEERQKAFDVWKQKIDEQKQHVAQLNRELQDVQHDYQMRPVKLWEDDAKFKQDVAEKQKQIDEAQSKLNDLQDQAHKSGVPDSITE